MLTLTELELHDFLSHQKSNINLENQGLVLIAGRNADQGGSSGAGKSTIAEGILFALFGVTARGLKSDSVIRSGQGGCRVTLRGRKDDTDFSVTRTRGPAALHFEISGNDQSGASLKATQEKIETFLGADFNTFVSTIIFPQRTLGIAALPASEQRELLGRILDLDRFEDAFERVKLYRNTVYKELDKLKNQQTVLNSQLAAEESHLDQLLSAKADFSADKAARIARAKEQVAKISNLPTLEFNPLELQELEAEDPFYAHQRVLAEQAMQGKQYAKAASELANRRGRLQGQLGALREPQDQSESICNACGQELPPEALHRALEAQKHHLIDYLAQTENIKAALAEIQDQERALNAQKALADQAITDKLRSVRALVERVSELRAIDLDIKARANQLLAAQANLEEEQSRVWTADAAISLTEAKINKVKEQIPEIKAKTDEMEQELHYVDFWHNGFGNQGIRHFYLATITPFLSERASYYLSELTNGQGQVQISTQRETKQGNMSEAIHIEASVGNSGTYEGASGGEKQRISIALLFALSELMATRAKLKVNILFLDEPFESLGPDDVGQVINLLRKELTRYKDSVFVITHNESLASEFESVITVEKSDGISRITKN